jgi:hypothetical protein
VVDVIVFDATRTHYAMQQTRSAGVVDRAATDHVADA